MLFFQINLAIISFISLTHTILDDDILYDIKWQPELTSVCLRAYINEFSLIIFYSFQPIGLGNNFLFTSKRKEKYSCVLPTTQTKQTVQQNIFIRNSLSEKSIFQTWPETILLTEIKPIFENLYSQTLCTYRVSFYIDEKKKGHMLLNNIVRSILDI